MPTQTRKSTATANGVTKPPIVLKKYKIKNPKENSRINQATRIIH